MSDDAGTVRIEDLLAHGEWLARLARRLVKDPQAADDIVQETWMAALRRPPARLSRVRAWLATVARNAVRARGRTEARRRRREQQASRPEATPDTAVLVERAERNRDLAGLVLGLPEPYRATILLCFDAGLAPHEIARHLGIPASTARGRLERALALLRQEVNRRQAGDGRHWLAALLPLAGLESTRAAGSGGAIAAGGLIVGTKVKLALGVAILLILAAVVSTVGPDSGVPEVEETGRAASARGAGETPEIRDAVPVREDELATGAFSGRVLDRRRHPKAGARVVLMIDGALRNSAVSSEDGRYRLRPGVLTEGSWVSIVARDAADASLCAMADPATLRASMRARSTRGTEDFRVGDLVLRRGHPLEVIVESGGRGVEGARVDLLGGKQVRAGHVLTARTDASGRARFDGLPPEQYVVAASFAGLAAGVRPVGLPRPEGSPLRIGLAPPRTVEVEVVEAPDDHPVAGVALRVMHLWGSTHRSTIHEHRPSLDLPPTDERGISRIEGIDRDPSLRLGLAARGYAFLWWADDPGAWVPRFDRYVPIPTDEDRMRIVLPAPRRVAWPIVGGEIPIPPDGTRIACHLAKDRPMLAPPGARHGRVENGRLVIDGLLDRPFAAVAETPDRAIVRILIGGRETEGPPITFTRPRTLDVVARHEDGSPAAGITVSVMHPDGWSLGPRAETDASGAARLEGLLAARGRVHAYPPGWIFGDVDLTAGDAHTESCVESRRKGTIGPTCATCSGGSRPIP